MSSHHNMMHKNIVKGLINQKERLIIDAITKHLGYLPDKELLIANLRKVTNTDNTEDIVYDGVKLIKFEKNSVSTQDSVNHYVVNTTLNYSLYE